VTLLGVGTTGVLLIVTTKLSSSEHVPLLSYIQIVLEVVIVAPLAINTPELA
jgi:hypothetical protein